MGDNPHVILRPFLKVELHHTEIVKWILLGVVQQNYSEDFSGCQSIACVEFLPVRCSPDETARIRACNHGHIEIQHIVPPVLSAERCEATLIIATVTYQYVADEFSIQTYVNLEGPSYNCSDNVDRKFTTSLDSYFCAISNGVLPPPSRYALFAPFSIRSRAIPG